MGKLRFALRNHASATELLRKSAFNHVRATKKLTFAVRTFPERESLDVRTTKKLTFALRTFSAANEMLGRSVFQASRVNKKLTFAARTFRPEFSLDKLLKMKEVEVVEVAKSLGLKVSERDRKNDTIEKIIRSPDF